MRTLKLTLIIFLGLIVACVNNTNNESVIANTENKDTLKVVDNPYYNSAYCEIVSMLDNKIPMDYK